MPSPFPGMDPYLEGDDWTSFHAHFATEIARQLTPRLRPKYIALPEKRFDLLDEGGVAIESIYPDVGVADVDSAAQKPSAMRRLRLLSFFEPSWKQRSLTAGLKFGM